MSKGVFYSVGVGPGDPSLLTFQAARIIGLCDIIAAPDSGGARNMALEIAAEHIRGKRIITCPMPMTRDTETMRGYHQQAAARLREALDEGLNIAFLTLGDPAIYSTAMYVHNLLKAAGYETRVIPGVPSFCAAAASLNTALCEGGQALHILPACYDGEYSGSDGVKVLMKPGQALEEALAAHGREGAEIMLVERASLPDERVYRSLDEIPEQTGYFSLAIVKPAPTETAAGHGLEAANDHRLETTALPAKEFFPLFISSPGKKALIIGGGHVAARRINTLRHFSFEILVVAPEVTTEIEALRQQQQLTLLRREFRDDDLQGCFLAVAATDDREVNRRIGELAAQAGIWVSVADRHEECSFLFPAIALNEQIVAGLTSEGQSHQAVRQAARRVRETLK